MSDQDLVNILQESKKWNSAHGITGMLLYVKGSFWKPIKRELVPRQAGRFVQVLEGKKEDVEEIFALIKTDKRHFELVVVNEAACEVRGFKSWDMGFKSLELKEYKNLNGYFELEDDFLVKDVDTANAPLDFLKSFYTMSKMKV